jgi:putative transposase
MKRKRYSVEQIVSAVKQHYLDAPAADIARKLSSAEQTLYHQNKGYGDGWLEASEVRDLKQLRKAAAKLKKLAADLSLDTLMLQGPA